MDLDPFLDSIGETGVTTAILSDRRPPPPASLLRLLLARAADVPSEDVELRYECPECGARHGRPAVEYPATPSGSGWHGDALELDGTTVAAAASRHALALGMVRIADASELIDAAALSPVEAARIAEAPEPERRLARARAWARKSALVRALGHTSLHEPSILALADADGDPGVACVVRTAPEIGPLWRDIRVHDLRVPDGLAAAVAVLPSTGPASRAGAAASRTVER